MKRSKNNLSSFARVKLFKKIAFFFAIFILLTILGVVLWFLRNGEFMQVAHFNIVGTRMIAAEDVLALIGGGDGLRGGFSKFIWPPGHRFAYLSDKNLAHLIAERFPWAKTVSASWDYSTRSITIHIYERREVISWCFDSANIQQSEAATKPLINGRKCFWLDNQGLILGEAPDSEGTLISVVIDKSGQRRVLGQTAIPQEKLKNLIEIIQMIDDFEWVIEDIVITDPLLKDATITISSGQDILISLNRSSREDGQIILNTIVNSGKWPRVEYVNLRIKGRGFYKLR